MSLTFTVTRFPWIAIRLLCSNILIRNASEASCRARRACGVTRNVCVEDICWKTSRTSRWNGSFRIKSSVDFWYLRISRRATVPGRNFLGLLIRPIDCFFVVFPSPLSFLAVSLVLVIFTEVSCVCFLWFLFWKNKKVTTESQNTRVTTHNLIYPGVPRGK